MWFEACSIALALRKWQHNTTHISVRKYETVIQVFFFGSFLFFFLWKFQNYFVILFSPYSWHLSMLPTYSGQVDVTPFRRRPIPNMSVKWYNIRRIRRCAPKKNLTSISLRALIVMLMPRRANKSSTRTTRPRLLRVWQVVPAGHPAEGQRSQFWAATIWVLARATRAGAMKVLNCILSVLSRSVNNISWIVVDETYVDEVWIRWDEVSL